MGRTFEFTVILIDVPGVDRLLTELVRGAIEQAGCAATDADTVSAGCRRAVDELAGERSIECTARFKTDNGSLVITLSSQTGRQWRIAGPLLPAD